MTVRFSETNTRPSKTLLEKVGLLLFAASTCVWHMMEGHIETLHQVTQALAVTDHGAHPGVEITAVATQQQVAEAVFFRRRQKDEIPAPAAPYLQLVGVEHLAAQIID
jgi:hypothetical protein